MSSDACSNKVAGGAGGSYIDLPLLDGAGAADPQGADDGNGDGGGALDALLLLMLGGSALARRRRDR